MLRGKSCLRPQTQATLYKACVWSSVSYALDCVGLTPGGNELLRRDILRQVRAMLRCPSHVARISSEQVMRDHGMDLPKRMIKASVERMPPCRPEEANGMVPIQW